MSLSSSLRAASGSLFSPSTSPMRRAHSLLASLDDAGAPLFSLPSPSPHGTPSSPPPAAAAVKASRSSSSSSSSSVAKAKGAYADHPVDAPRLRTTVLRPPPDTAAQETAELHEALQRLHDATVRYDQGRSKVFLQPVDPRIAPEYDKVPPLPPSWLALAQNKSVGRWTDKKCEECVRARVRACVCEAVSVRVSDQHCCGLLVLSF